jgi:cobalt/nickel transport system permease protein
MASGVGLGSLDDLARRDTPAGRLDPRVKLLATAAFVAVVASFGRLDLLRLAPLALYPAALAALGEVPARPVLLRLALASPLALGLAAAEPFLDRTPALALGPLAFSAGGLAACTILAKLLLSLGAALLLAATTPFEEIAFALRRLGAPRALVAQLLLTHRYLFVLAGEARALLGAHALRAPERPRPTLRTAAALLGQLLGRALDRAERIHAAMRLCGFRGVLPTWRGSAPGRADAAFAAATLLLLAATRAVDLPARLGGALLGGTR